MAIKRGGRVFSKNRAILVQKLGEEKKIVKIRFRLFYDYKKI